MELIAFTIDRKAIHWHATFNLGSEDPSAPERTMRGDEHEAPLPECTAAFDKLKAVACEVMGWAKSYTEGMTVYKINQTITKNGTRSVSLKLKKALDTIGGQLHPLTTPFFKIDEPGEGESGKMEIKPASAELVKTALREAERYVEGERSQQLLNLDADEADAGMGALAEKGRNATSDQTELVGV